jgi:hypothetical protein
MKGNAVHRPGHTGFGAEPGAEVGDFEERLGHLSDVCEKLRITNYELLGGAAARFQTPQYNSLCSIHARNS